MAKGIRSKCKREARRELRKVLSIPIIKKQTLTAHKALVEGLKEKNQSSSIVSLKKVLGKGKGAEKAVAMEAEDADGDDEVEVPAEVEPPKSKSAIAKEEFVNKKKGSKPKNNPGKELVWF
jgi:N-methylhydantoinase A/oxoprolinase/acetone carboxylase beta subunit